MNTYFNNTPYFTTYISEEVQTAIALLLSIFVGTPLAIMGVATNIINVIVFIKLGVKDSTNISLLGLSVSDLCSSIFVLWVLLHYSPSFQEWDIPIRGTMYLFGVNPRSDFTKITGVITAFISLERCLCVTFPLTIKQMITPKRVKFIIIGIFITVFVLASPVYIFARIVPVVDSSRNKTIYYTVIPYNHDRTSWTRVYEIVSAIVLSHVLNSINFLIIIVSTSILVRSLKKSSQWRNQTTSKAQDMTSSPDADTANSAVTSRSGNQMSARDSRVVKMLIAISVLFVVCFTPIVVAIFLFLFVPGLTWGGRNMEFHPLMYFIMSTFESVNASSNILIYYRMSSSYNGMFKKIFGCNSGKVEEMKKHKI